MKRRWKIWKRWLCLLLIPALLGTMQLISVQASAPEEETAVQEAPMRKVVDQEHPALLIPFYGKSKDSDVMENGDTLVERWNTIPEDIRGNAIAEIHPGSIKNKEDAKIFFERQLKIAQENQIPISKECGSTESAGNGEV